ncbi:MAG: PAS domain S-box protein [Proteobacteria bacterium]|nr:PAS domain S-box protein [Pseudomonadota bacterium]
MVHSKRPAHLARLVPLVLTLVSLLFCQTLRADDRIVRVGVYEAPPKIVIDSAGKPAGIYVELIEDIARKEGWRVRYVAGRWAENLERLERGEIDLMPDMARTDERAQRYAFPDIPVLSSWFQLYVPKGRDLHSVMELNGKRILVLEHSVQEQAFIRLSQGFELNATLVAVADYPAMLAMVEHGEADAVVASRYQKKWCAKYHLEGTDVLFEPTTLFYAATKGDPKHLLAAIDRHLAVLKKDQDSIYYAELKRLGNEKPTLVLPIWLKIAGVVVVLVLLVSVAVSVTLKEQVDARTRELLRENAERRALQQRFMDIIEFLPDPTFAIDEHRRVIAWNQACEAMTGIGKDQIMGQGDYAYAEALIGERRPILIDLLDQTDAPIEATYTNVRRAGDRIYAEILFPNPHTGRSVYLWGVAAPLYDQNGSRRGAIETLRDITEQQKTEHALRASEREYRELVMLANSIILRWQPDGRITFLNEFGQRFFGYVAAELIGRHVVGALVPEFGADGRDLRTLIDDITGNPHQYERSINENMCRDGRRVWIDWTNKVVTDADGQVKEILSIGSDITERKQAGEQIHRLNEDLRRHAETLEQRVAERTVELAAINDEQRAIFESASAGIVLVQNRTIHRCNRKFEEMIGYAPGAIIGRPVRILHPDEESYARFMRDVYTELANGETRRLETRILRQDGSVFWARLSLCACDSQSPIQGTVGIVEDVTVEREVMEQLRQALETAQEADRVKSIFLATMSHELRTPLNSIIGFTGIMLQGLAGPLNPEQHKQMGMVQKSARHLLDLINDVLDISKISAGQLQLVATPFQLRTSIEKTVRLIVPLAAQKGIEVRMDLADSVGEIVTDQRRLEQLLLNLLNNAVKFTEQGWVSIACRADNGDYLLTVADTGIGIHAHEIPLLFQPFHQLDSGSARKHEGTGLGLSICSKLVEMMGGSITVTSQWGQGSAFAVRLPRRNQEARNEQPVAGHRG